ncbi:protein FAR1-RELATED SEQUENCE 5-like [Bidens hawaiensis]|uniref:protein FAR1-RELATED SEQUENCE 5-like n=1 Tax=Bidens hawaiensis TaxID=980011 RepID=UPI00404B849B
MGTQYGGFEKVGATKDDCKNSKQGLNFYIREYDDEMIVQILCAKRTFSSDYSFEYDVNDDRDLIGVFWANEISRSNYLAFGDIISFDATFKTNKYKMVFVPFMAIDNHCHSVTVGWGLLASKTIESYTWLLQMLLKSFGHAPKVVVTDQDPSIKQAIASVFPKTRHRFDWIPAFYRDEPLFRLMRTTSRSESENHFFGKATNSQLTLVEFFNRFDFCMEIQRYNGRWCDHDNEMNEIVGGVSQFSSCEEEGGFLRCKIMDFNALCLRRMVSLAKSLLQHVPAKDLNNMVKKFPKRYINDRWRKEAAVNIITVSLSEFGNDLNRKIKEISREIKYADEYLINSYVADVDELIKVRDEMNLMIEKADLNWYERVRPSKRDRFAVVLGFEQPSEVTVHVPTGIRNKGRGSHKRIKSKKEIATSRSGRSYRECHIWHQPRHNSRTCKALQQQPQQ